MIDDEPTPLERQQIGLTDPTAHTFWHWVRFGIVTDVAAANGSTTIVDIGAGSGMFGDRLSTTHPALEYRFSELSSHLDAALISRFGPGARVEPHERVGPHATAAMLDVIEHIDDERAMLRSWLDRMEPGTRLVVTVPAMQWAFSSFDTELGHHRRYSRRRLRVALTDAGFEVERCDYLFPELLPLLVKRRLRPSTNTVDMPQLSHWNNRIGHAISATTARLRRIWPAGTSVVAVARVR